MAYPEVGPRSRLGAGLKRAIATEVRGIFNDRTRGEQPVVRRDDGWFGKQAVVWRVHGDVTSMLVGGVAALLLQMLHPKVLAGVWDHSGFRDDMQGRLRRTARFIALTTYGSTEEAETVVARVRRVHDGVRGVLPSGEAYEANDPELLAWVHLTETVCFLDAWMRYAEPRMPLAAQDRYFVEMSRVAEALGAAPVPRGRAEARRLMAAMRPALRADERTREVAGVLLRAPTQGAASSVMAGGLHQLTMEAAIDLLPEWARRMHGLRAPVLAPLVRVGTLGVARTLRWAFA